MPKRLSSTFNVQRLTKNQNGFTLIEVMVAAIITATVVSGMALIFIVASKQSSVTSNKAAALYHANETLKMLSSYVADDPDPTQQNGGFAAPESTWFTLAVRRPNWQGCADAGGDWYADAGGDCYALYGAAGAGIAHYRTQASLSPDFASAPINGRVRYTVVNDDPAAGWKKVTVTARWDEPQ